MKELKNAPKGSVVSKFFCSVFGHRYVVTKRVTSHIKEYRCLHCQEQVTTNANGNLSKLTPRLKEINATLAMIYQKRNAKHLQRSVA